MRKQTTFIILSGFMFLMSPLTQAAESVNDVLKEAKALHKKADTLQGAWVTTAKLIKKAEATLKKGDKTKALKLAKMARLEARSSIAQAKAQAKNWAEPPYIQR